MLLFKYKLMERGINMGIYYYKFFDLLSRKGIKKGEFAKMANISTTTMAKLANNQVVQMDVIDKICKTLGCQPGDICEYIETQKED